MTTPSCEPAHAIAPSTRDVLHDLTTERGLRDWRVHRVGNRDVIVGAALSDRIQDNRLQRKRKHRGGAVPSERRDDVGNGGDTAALVVYTQCSFVVVSPAAEPTLTMERLMDLHTTATSGVPTDAAAPPIEKVYLCLTDAGNISYYQLASMFPPFSLPF